MSGAAADSRWRFFKIGASADAEICSLGGAAGVVLPHSTIFGNCGTTFGGSGDASGWIRVWRGCVTRCGCDRIVWRGLYASAPSGGSGSFGLPAGLGFAAGADVCAVDGGVT